MTDPIPRELTPSDVDQKSATSGSIPINSDLTIEFVGGKIGPFAAAELHARGGLGEVFRATDGQLNRTVAVKCLQKSRAHDADSQRRFLVEAEITARLEHPGVVPVYSLCGDSLNGPAYAMRFIEGPTLAETIQCYHAGARDPLAFRRLLQSYLQVCQTVAYAHSRGVIHRDLKPQNVISGKFGETLVVDWGLAKIVGRPDELRGNKTSEKTLAPLLKTSDSAGSETQMGSAVGTPAYMSPEQAAGRWNVVDHRSDIYGLGAVLYTLLSGKPPLSKGDWPELQQKIQQGNFPSPQQVKADIPNAINAICLRAMALAPSSRYASAASLAVDIEHWLAGEPVSAYREGIAARFWRWLRGHRALVSATAALLVTAFIGLIIGTVLLQKSQHATEQQRQVAVAARAKSDVLNRFLVDDLLKQADPVNNRTGTSITVRELLDKATERLDEQASLVELPDVEAEIRSVVGHAYEYLNVLDKAESHYQRAWKILSNLHGPGSLPSLEARNRYVFAVVSQEPRPEAEVIAVAALVDCERFLGFASPETADAANNLAEVYVHRGDRLNDAVILRERSSKVLHAALGPDDNRTIEIDNNLGVTLVRSGRPADAAVVLQSVVERRRTHNPEHYEFGRNLGNLGGALVAAGQFSQAIGPLQEAEGLSIQSKDIVGQLSARNLMAAALEGEGKWEEAETAYLAVLAERRAIREQQALLPRSIGALARLYAKQEKWPVAAGYLIELMLAEQQDANPKTEILPVLLADALAGNCEPVIAEPLLRECHRVVQNQLWKGDWLTAEISSRHADTLRLLNRFEEAETLLLAADNDVSRAFGVPEWGRLVSRKRIAALYEAWSKPDEAAKWR